MTCLVMQSRGEYRSARRTLRRRGLSFLPPIYGRLPVARNYYRGKGIGDIRKSWDVLWMLERIKNFGPEARVLDMGAYRSELMAALVKSGVRDATGIDLDFPTGTGGAGGTYVKGDMMATPFDDDSFDVITSVSVIEHGFDQSRLFAEVSRLLRPGGIFLASFDYWPEKIDTSKTPLFGLPWNIFSTEEVQALLDSAQTFGLHTTGTIELQARQPTIRFEGRRYTFGLLEVQKKAA